MPGGLTRTVEGDVVLIYYQEKPALYARIEAIRPDVKKDWYQISLLLLTIPAQPVTWILREEYINGTPFTMGGQGMKIEKIVRTLPGEDRGSRIGPAGGKKPGRPSKVIPFKKQPT